MFNPYDYYITPEEYEEAEQIGIDRRNLETRIRLLGWGKQKAMSVPIQKKMDRKALTAIAKENNISYSVLKTRLHKGWDEITAVTKPLQTTKKFIEESIVRNKQRRIYPAGLVDLAESNGICYDTLVKRIKRGWHFEEAASLPPSLANGIIRQRIKHGPEYRNTKAFRELY